MTKASEAMTMEAQNRETRAVALIARSGQSSSSTDKNSRAQLTIEDSNSKGKKYSSRRVKCYNCSDFGHVARDCDKPPRQGNRLTIEAGDTEEGDKAASH